MNEKDLRRSELLQLVVVINESQNCAVDFSNRPNCVFRQSGTKFVLSILSNLGRPSLTIPSKVQGRRNRAINCKSQ